MEIIVNKINEKIYYKIQNKVMEENLFLIRNILSVILIFISCHRSSSSLFASFAPPPPELPEKNNSNNFVFDFVEELFDCSLTFRRNSISLWLLYLGIIFSLFPLLALLQFLFFFFKVVF